MTQLPGMRIVTDPYMPTWVRVKYPKKGPYYKRRVKRSAADRGNYIAPDAPFIIMGGVLFCHPDFRSTLERLIENGD